MQGQICSREYLIFNYLSVCVSSVANKRRALLKVPAIKCLLGKAAVPQEPKPDEQVCKINT